MRADLDLLRQIPSAPQTSGAGLAPSMTGEPAAGANDCFSLLLMQRLGPAASAGGEPTAAELSAFEQADVENGIDPLFVAIPRVEAALAPNVSETDLRVDVSTRTPRAPVPLLPMDPVAGHAAASAGAPPRAARGDASAPPSSSLLDPSDTTPHDSPPRSAAAGSGAQTADVGLGGPSASARSDPEPSPPARPEPPSARDTMPSRVEPADPAGLAQRLALSPEPTLPAARPDPSAKLAAPARPHEDGLDTAGSGREKHAATSPLRPAQAGLVAPEPSPLEAARPIAPGDRERKRPNVAPSLETSPASPAIRESTAPSSPAPAERTAPPPPTPSAAVVQQVEWLARQGGGTARMRLSPASLGEIEVQVELQQGRVAVVVRAREQAGQQALMTERAAITQLFTARDLRVADFIVTPMDGGTPAGDAGANGDSAASAGREHGLGAEHRLRPDSQSASTRSTAAARGTADTGTNKSFGRLDVHV